MKSKLLRKLREKGRNQISIDSFVREKGVVKSMIYSYSDDKYKGLFSYGNTPEEVEEKAIKIYLTSNLETIRNNYNRYTRKYRIIEKQYT